MALYRLHINHENQQFTLLAKSLDMTHPYFVSIKDIIFPRESKIIVNPQKDEIYKKFKEAVHLMFPFQSVTLIEELKDEPSFTINNPHEK